jgi:hypothetical protein
MALALTELATWLSLSTRKLLHRAMKKAVQLHAAVTEGVSYHIQGSHFKNPL